MRSNYYNSIQSRLFHKEEMFVTLLGEISESTEPIFKTELKIFEIICLLPMYFI